MGPTHSAEATVGAASILMLLFAWAGNVLTALFVVPPMTWGTHVTAAALGAIGGWMFRNIAPGVHDGADKTIAILMAGGCGGFFGPLASAMAAHYWGELTHLPMSGVIPLSVAIGMILPFVLGWGIQVIDRWKNNPDAFFAALRKFRDALRGGR